MRGSRLGGLQERDAICHLYAMSASALRPDPQVQTFGVILLPGFALMSFAAATEPLRAANLLAGRPLYEIALFGEAETALSSSGLPAPTRPLPTRADGLTAVFVCAGGAPADWRRPAVRFMMWRMSVGPFPFLPERLRFLSFPSYPFSQPCRPSSVPFPPSLDARSCLAPSPSFERPRLPHLGLCKRGAAVSPCHVSCPVARPVHESPFERPLV